MLRYEKEIPGNLENWFQGNIETLHVNPVDRRNVALAIRLLFLKDFQKVGELVLFK